MITAVLRCTLAFVITATILFVSATVSASTIDPVGPGNPGAPVAPVGKASIGNSNCPAGAATTQCVNAAAPAAGAGAPQVGPQGGAANGGAAAAPTSTGAAATPATASTFAQGDRLGIGEQFMRNISDGLVNAAIGNENDPRGGVLGYVIDELIGRQGSNFSPIISCEDSAAADTNCNPWFIEQLGIMRTLGLWLITPLVMLAMIQAVMRGSVFLVMRAAAIMLPVAVIGTVAIAFMTQLLLDISDDLASAMFTFGGSDFTRLRQGIAAYNDETTSVFGIIFTIVALLSGLVIMLEMIIREIGVYLTVVFMPLAFAGLVWPVSAGWTKTLIRLLAGLIFSKVFIAGGIALGLAAVENGGTVGPETEGLWAVANASAIFIIAAIFGVRMLDWTPGGADSKQARIGEPTAGFGKGDFTDNIVKTVEGRRKQAKADAEVGAGARGFNRR